MKTTTILLSAGVLFGASAANAAVLKSYDFNGDLSDTFGVGADMTSAGGVVANGSYFFGENEGLRLIDALADTSDYAVEFLLTIDANTKTFNKLIDFQDLTEDEGLYTQADELYFFPVGTVDSSPNVPEDTPVLIGFERADDIMTGFVNGAEVYSEIDATDLAVSGDNILNFFIDDLDFGGGTQPEAFSGSVDFIRFHDDRSTFGQTSAAVPLPAAAPLLLAGLGLFGLMARRRRSAAA